MSEANTQFELFELPAQTAQPRRSLAIVPHLNLRPDHAVLLLIMGLVGASVVFAVGVERGKRLARSERITPEVSARRVAETTVADKPAGAVVAASPKNASEIPSIAARSPSNRPVSATAPAAPNTVSTTKPRKRIVGRSQFAVQLVSYSQPQLAQRELQRLQQRGEQAFLVNKEGRRVLLVGPFPTKRQASAKLAMLKQSYRDGFVKTLYIKPPLHVNTDEVVLYSQRQPL